MKRIIVFIVLAALVLLFLYFPASSASSNGFPAAGDGQYRLGWLPSPPGDYAKINISGYKATLSSAVDLSSQLPPVGDQGNQGSCVGWATSYYYKSWQEGREHPSWSLSNTDYQFSPSFVYNQINGGHDAGSCFEDAFNLLETKGDVDIAEMPYNEDNCTTQPTSTQLEAAKPYRIPEDWGYFWINYNQEPFATPNPIDEAKTYLNGGNMLIMGIPVYYDFPDIDGNPAKPYYDYDGSSWYAGGHAVAIVGYDDNINPGGSDADHRGGFKMVNSWGPGWNGESEGFVYLSYDFVKRYVSEAWSMNDLSPDTPAISSLSASSGLAGDTITIYGNNFGTYRRSARVSFNGVNAVNPTFTNGIITAEVPDGATTGSLVVYDWDGAASNAEQFSILQAPPPVPSSYTYYFAEGNIGADFQEYLCISNPAETTANATITYLFTDGSTAGGPIAISPRSRATVNVSSISGPGDGVSAIITSGQSIVCERPMYFNRDGITGGHDVMAATAPFKTWYFAEGYTGPGFEEYVCVLNPGSTAADLTFRFQTQEAGEIVKTGYDVGAHTRATFKVNDILGPNYQASLKLESSQPVVAERPMYFNYQGVWTGGHCVIGAASAGAEWFFAEGYTGDGFHEWLCLQNPGASETTVEITYLTQEAGVLPVRIVKVPAGSRQTVFVNADAGEGYQLSTRLKVTAGPDVVVERPMYFNYGGCTGGHDVVGYTP